MMIKRETEGSEFVCFFFFICGAGMPEQAVPAYEKAVQLDPTNEQFAKQLAEARAALSESMGVCTCLSLLSLSVLVFPHGQTVFFFLFVRVPFRGGVCFFEPLVLEEDICALIACGYQRSGWVSFCRVSTGGGECFSPLCCDVGAVLKGRKFWTLTAFGCRPLLECLT